MEGISQRTMFLLKRKGPTSFVVREDGEEAKRRVRIGAENACSCGGGGRSELCAHIVFVFVKVLGVPKGNPLVWQLSLIDRELDEALKCDMAMRRSEEAIKRASNLDPAKTVQTGKTGSKAARKPLTDEDPCPICYDGLAGDDPDRVLWCRHGCGTNIHARCLRIWFDHLVRQPVPFHPAFGYSIKVTFEDTLFNLMRLYCCRRVLEVRLRVKERAPCAVQNGESLISQRCASRNCRQPCATPRYPALRGKKGRTTARFAGTAGSHPSSALAMPAQFVLSMTFAPRASQCPITPITLSWRKRRLPPCLSRWSSPSNQGG